MSARPGNGSIEFARSLQQKYELYFTGLIFTLLAAAVQTANFTEIPIQNALELSAWIVLLIAGLAALSRLEWMPSSHMLHGQLSNTKEILRGVREAEARGARVLAEETGDEIKPAEYIATQSQTIKDVEKLAAADGLKASIKHEVRKWGFLLGLILLVASRGYVPSIRVWYGLIT